MSKTLIRQNYNDESEQAINTEISNDLYAAYFYGSMATYFAQDNIGLLGFSKFYRLMTRTYAERVKYWMNYQNKRGGRVILKDLPKPESDSWNTPLEAMERTLKMEKTEQQALLDIHNIADSNQDPHLEHCVKDEYLKKQVSRIKVIGDYVSQLKRLTTGDHGGLGEWMFDQKLMKITLLV